MADEQEEAIQETVTVESTDVSDDPLARLEAKIDALRTEYGAYHDRIAEHEARLASLEAGASGYAGAEHSHDGYAAGDHQHEREEAAHGRVDEGETPPRARGGILANFWYNPVGRRGG